MNEIIFKRNHDRPQRIGYRNDVLFRATVHQGLKKRPRKKIYAGKLNEEDMYFFKLFFYSRIWLEIHTNDLFCTVAIKNIDLTIPRISSSGSFGSIDSFLWQLSWITWHHFGLKIGYNRRKIWNISGVEIQLCLSSLALSCLWKINDVAKPESHQLFKCWISKKYPGGQSLVVSPNEKYMYGTVISIHMSYIIYGMVKNDHETYLVSY